MEGTPRHLGIHVGGMLVTGEPLVDVVPVQANGLAQIGRYLNEMAEHLRGLAYDLRPFLLRDLGLEGSVRSLVDGLSSETTRVVVTGSDADGVLATGATP